MTRIATWRQYDAKNQTPHPQSGTVGVQKLRPLGKHSACEASNERSQAETRSDPHSRSEAGAPLTASLTRRPLGFLRGEFLPCEPPSGDAGAYQRETVRVVPSDCYSGRLARRDTGTGGTALPKRTFRASRASRDSRNSPSCSYERSREHTLRRGQSQRAGSRQKVPRRTSKHR